jgi:NADPH:quinone reductase
MDIPATMNFIEVASPGGADVMRLVTGPVPTPGPGEVLVRVLAAGVNRPDLQQRMGRYPPPPDANPVLGLEVAGEVVAVGDAGTRWQLGDHVTALTNGGGYAEYCTVPAAQALPWPHGYDAVRAAGLAENYFTVWANLFMLGRLVASEAVLIHGGTSGIGTTAIQLAKAYGATVYATAGSDEKVAACRRLGADGAFNHRSQDFLTEIEAATGGRGVDLVLDMVGAPYFRRNLRCLAPDGRLVLIAFLGGAKLEAFDLVPIMIKRLTVTGSTMRPRSPAQKAAIAQALSAQVWPLLDAGRCAPLIHRVFPLAEAGAAHALMESSAHIGKIVLKVAA